MSVPLNPKIYHILHYDRLDSVLKANCLLSDAKIAERDNLGTNIGMAKIKVRRLNELTLQSHPDLFVGECVPFYFCPRSIMLYILRKKNHPEVTYRGGQEAIIHLVADLITVVDWANKNKKRWAFTASNAGSYFFEDYCDLSRLNEINWNAVKTRSWIDCREEKQAEFLLQDSCPWNLIESIGVISTKYQKLVNGILSKARHRPKVMIKRNWYY